jgi:hypothetical protein
VKKKRNSTEQIVAGLKQAEMRMSVDDPIRQMGITEQTYHRWKRKYGGLESDHVRVLSPLVWLRRRPEAVFCDNGAEITGQIILLLGLSSQSQDGFLQTRYTDG